MKTLRAAGLRRSQILISASRGPNLRDIGVNLNVVVLEDTDSYLTPPTGDLLAEFDRLTDGRFSKFYAEYSPPEPITVNDPGNKLRDTGYMDLISPDKKETS